MVSSHSYLPSLLCQLWSVTCASSHQQYTHLSACIFIILLIHYSIYFIQSILTFHTVLLFFFLVTCLFISNCLVAHGYLSPTVWVHISVILIYILKSNINVLGSLCTVCCSAWFFVSSNCLVICTTCCTCSNCPQRTNKVDLNWMFMDRSILQHTAVWCDMMRRVTLTTRCRMKRYRARPTDTRHIMAFGGVTHFQHWHAVPTQTGGGCWATFVHPPPPELLTRSNPSVVSFPTLPRCSQHFSCLRIFVS